MNLKKIIKDYKTIGGTGTYFDDDVINLFAKNGFYGDFEMESEIYFHNPDNWQVSLVWTKFDGDVSGVHFDGDTFSVNGVDEHKMFKDPNEAIAYAKELVEKPIEKVYRAYSVEGAMLDKYRMKNIKESELEHAKEDIENFCLKQSAPCTYEIYESTEEYPLGNDYEEPVWSFTNAKRYED